MATDPNARALQSLKFHCLTGFIHGTSMRACERASVRVCGYVNVCEVNVKIIHFDKLSTYLFRTCIIEAIRCYANRPNDLSLRFFPF